MFRVILFVMGVGLIALGSMLIVKPSRYRLLGGMPLDLSGYNVYLGIGLVAIGLGFVWDSLRRKE
jgi:hypothetical protein